MEFIDTHAHLSCFETLETSLLLIQRATLSGISTIVNVNTNKLDLEKGIELEKRSVPFSFYNVAGIPPHRASEDYREDLLFIEEKAKEGVLKAIGEIGFDTFEKEQCPRSQHEIFQIQIALAKQTNLPVVFHCRQAFKTLFTACDQSTYQGPALLHCFTGDYEEAKQAIDRGWLISLSGILTFKKSTELRDLVKELPLSCLVLETDTPYLAPLPYRGKTNEPAFLLETAKVLAEIKKVSLEEVAIQTSIQARNFFRLDRINN